MIKEVLERTRNYLDSFSYLDGYAIKYFRFNDKDLGTDNKFIVFLSGSAGTNSDVYVQRHQVRILVVGLPSTVFDDNQTVKNIVSKFRSSDSNISGIIKFQMVGNPTGPMYMDNDRPVFEINVTAFTEDL